MPSTSKHVNLLFPEDKNTKSDFSNEINDLNTLIADHYNLLKVDHVNKDGKDGIVFYFTKQNETDIPSQLIYLG